jgi:chaperonin GroES
LNNLEQASNPMQDVQPTQAIEQAAPKESLRLLVESKNIAKDLKEEQIRALSVQVSEGFEYDLRSREQWEKNLTEWTKLALQTKEEKSWPWPNASNVKYPLLSTAAMQFNARAYPSLVPATGNIVKGEIIGKDPQGQKLEQANRIASFMSYQLLHEMQDWEEDMDKLMIMLPIVGTVFKKTYYNSVLKHNVSELILPKDIVVNYWSKSLETSERISQILRLNKRQVKERMMSGIYLEEHLGEPQISVGSEAPIGVMQDATLPYEIVEQHTYFDLDDDGYAEPYVVTFERNSRTILRVAARFDEDTIFVDKDGKLQKIEPIQYFTKFSFIPNPDGGFYDIGFGLLLSPLNESVNTLINQLIDAGTLSNLQGGFLGKGLKLKMGESQWVPGEWKTVNNTADDLRKQVMPLPLKEPSPILFQLMGSLITSGKELASVAEIFVGKMPGQNTPATTTMATIEQGMKVFTAVYKRIYRSLKSEYKKLFALNKIYLDATKYAEVMDIQVMPDDFDSSTYNVCPNADPSTPTQTEKLMKAQGLLELLPIGILDPLAVIKRVLEAQEQPAIDQLFSQQVQQTGQFQPPPDPKLQEMQMKGQIEQQKAQTQQQQGEFKAALAQRDQQFKQAMKAQEDNHNMQIREMGAKLDAAINVHKQRIFSVTEQAKTNQQLTQNAQKHTQDMQFAKEKAALQRQQIKNTSKTGKGTK